MREENFPPNFRREVLRSVPYVLFEERPSKVDGEDPTGYGEQYRSFVGGRQPSELPKGAADCTQDRKGEEIFKTAFFTVSILSVDIGQVCSASYFFRKSTSASTPSLGMAL